MASGSSDNTVRVWTLLTSKIEPISKKRWGCWRVLDDHNSTVWSVCFSANGTRLATGSSDRSILIYDTTSSKYSLLHKIRNSHDNYVFSLSFCTNPKLSNLLVSGSGDCSVKFWDVETGKKQHTIANAHGSEVNTVNFSPNGLVVVSGAHDGTVKLFGSVGGIWKEKFAFEKLHKDSVAQVVFTDDGRYIASASGDGTIKINRSSMYERHNLMAKLFLLIKFNRVELTYLPCDKILYKSFALIMKTLSGCDGVLETILCFLRDVDQEVGSDEDEEEYKFRAFKDVENNEMYIY